MQNQVATEGKISAPIITLAEAALISGHSEDHVMSLLKQGLVKGKTSGSNWRVYRMSLLAHMNRDAKLPEEANLPARAGATADASSSALGDEVWALRKSLEQERDGHAFERTLHEATKSQLSQTMEELNALRAEVTRLREQLNAVPPVVPAKKTGFFAMVRRAFSW